MFPPVIDNTIMATFTACPQAFHYAYIQRKAISHKSVHLHAGGAFAKALEVARLAYYVDGVGQGEAEVKGLQALTDTYGDFDAQESAKSLDRMLGAFEFYCSEWPFGEDFAQPALLGDKRAIEWSFALPLPILHPDTQEPILFAGRADTVDTIAGELYVHDDKTTGSLGDSWAKAWDMRGQFAGYAWALRELGYKSKGTLVRGVSILKTKYGRAEVLISQPDWKINAWYKSFLARLQLMVTSYQSNSYHQAFDEACNHYGGCEFKSLCMVEDPKPWLDAHYVERDWDPLRKISDSQGTNP